MLWYKHMLPMTLLLWYRAWYYSMLWYKSISNFNYNKYHAHRVVLMGSITFHTAWVSFHKCTLRHCFMCYFNLRKRFTWHVDNVYNIYGHVNNWRPELAAGLASASSPALLASSSSAPSSSNHLSALSFQLSSSSSSVSEWYGNWWLTTYTSFSPS